MSIDGTNQIYECNVWLTLYFAGFKQQKGQNTEHNCRQDTERKKEALMTSW